ncbi:hypothetical protein OROMI_010876 [Orobanche minor]
MFPEIMDVLLVNKDKVVDKLGKGKKLVPLFQQGSSSGIGTKSLEKSHGLKGSDFFINVDDYGTDSSYFGENEMLFDDSALMDLSCDNYLDDQYAILQSHLDGLDVPPGVEVPVPWFINNQETWKTALYVKLRGLWLWSKVKNGLRLPYPPMSGHFSQFGEKATASSSGVAEGISNPSSKSEGMNFLDRADYASRSLSPKIGALRKPNEEKYGDPKEFLKNFEQFKRFDIVEDFSITIMLRLLTRRPPKNRAKKIQDEFLRMIYQDL